jgi:hypothetical protein
VLGIIAVLIAWVPFLGILAIPVALLGALLGVIGLIYRLISRRGKVATSSIGLALSLGSIVLFVAMTGTAASRISEAMKEAETKHNRSNATAPRQRLISVMSVFLAWRAQRPSDFIRRTTDWVT